MGPSTDMSAKMPAVWAPLRAYDLVLVAISADVIASVVGELEVFQPGAPGSVLPCGGKPTRRWRFGLFTSASAGLGQIERSGRDKRAKAQQWCRKIQIMCREATQGMLSVSETGSTMS